MANFENEHTLLELQRIQKKISLLEQLQALQNWSNIRIMFEAKQNIKQEFIIVDQFSFPFSLETELRALIEDSLMQHERDIESLKFKLKLIK